MIDAVLDLMRILSKDEIDLKLLGTSRLVHEKGWTSGLESCIGFANIVELVTESSFHLN